MCVHACNEIYIGKTERIYAIASKNKIAKIRIQNQPSKIKKKENPTHIINGSVIEIID
jgi:hypothetical protein